MWMNQNSTTVPYLHPQQIRDQDYSLHVETLKVMGSGVRRERDAEEPLNGLGKSSSSGWR